MFIHIPVILALRLHFFELVRFVGAGSVDYNDFFLDVDALFLE